METILVENKAYEIEIHQRSAKPADIPRLVVVAFQPNPVASRILSVCIRAIQKYTPDGSYELWVVDNASPIENTRWLHELRGVNLALNRSRPVYPRWKDPLPRLKALLRGERSHPYEASYANAIALELAVRLIPPQTQTLMTLHMDTMPCHPGWLEFLEAKIEQGYAAAGMRMDRARHPAGVVHILGCMIHFGLFRSLGLDFFPSLPKHDVGDLVSVQLRQKGYNLFACRNTLWQPELAESIPSDSLLRHFLVDRSFDDDGNVIFLHLGRGVQKSEGQSHLGATPEEWIAFAAQNL